MSKEQLWAKQGGYVYQKFNGCGDVYYYVYSLVETNCGIVELCQVSVVKCR